jgi:hypothetical protein
MACPRDCSRSDATAEHTQVISGRFKPMPNERAVELCQVVAGAFPPSM